MHGSEEHKLDPKGVRIAWKPIPGFHISIRELLFHGAGALRAARGCGTGLDRTLFKFT
jgi:hypothetical protein